MLEILQNLQKYLAAGEIFKGGSSMLPKKTNSKYILGATIIEVMISIFLVIIGAVSLINLQGRMLDTQSSTYQRNEALEIAEAKMESLRGYPNIPGYDAISSGSDSFTGVNSTYQRRWHVSKSFFPNYAIISLSVSWSRRNNTVETINLTSTIARLNPILSGRAMVNFNLIPPPLNPANAN